MGTLLKYHKIQGVDKAVCTAEQKIAYNAVWNTCSGHIRDEWKAKAPTAPVFVQDEFIAEAVKLTMNNLRYSYEYDNISKRYDVDAIFCAINGGMRNYLNGDCILTSYEAIGNTFPANYLN